MVNNKKIQVKKKNWPGRRGTKAQGTRCREGKTGHNVQLGRKAGVTSRSQTVLTKLQRIAELAVRYPDSIFTTLVHLIDVDFLREAYHRTRKDASPGLDGVTAEEYGQNLEENLQKLHERMKSGGYKAPPVKGAWLEKEEGGQREIGIPEFEDKILQRAVSMVLGAVYEQDFYDFSHGFREGHNAHQALGELREQCMNMDIRFLVDADICGFFDKLDRAWMRKILQLRVNDGGILRLIGKWFKAGVVEEGILFHPDTGIVQGGVISPVLSNIFLHHVLDEWYVKAVVPKLKGKSFLIRYADDFVLGFELEEDAKWFMEELSKRLAEYNLTIHPKKTKLVSFRRPRGRKATGKENGTFDFLGFTHYWAKSRRGYWVVKLRTAKKRVRRSMKKIWRWCRFNRHTPLKKQHRTICQKLRGHYQYYGVCGNLRMLKRFYERVKEAWRYWLSRRSNKGNINWDKYHKLLEKYVLPSPRIVHYLK